jgi:hypothetical protein
MAISGQKSESSIRSYSRHVTDKKMRSMSMALTSHMGGFAEKSNASLKNR